MTILRLLEHFTKQLTLQAKHDAPTGDFTIPGTSWPSRQAAKTLWAVIRFMWCLLASRTRRGRFLLPELSDPGMELQSKANSIPLADGLEAHAVNRAVLPPHFKLHNL